MSRYISRFPPFSDLVLSWSASRHLTLIWCYSKPTSDRKKRCLVKQSKKEYEIPREKHSRDVRSRLIITNTIFTFTDEAAAPFRWGKCTSHLPLRKCFCLCLLKEYCTRSVDYIPGDAVGETKGAITEGHRHYTRFPFIKGRASSSYFPLALSFLPADLTAESHLALSSNRRRACRSRLIIYLRGQKFHVKFKCEK